MRLTWALLLAPAAADYLKVASYGDSTSCEGEALMIISSVIECETNGASSYRISCLSDKDNATYAGANILTFLTPDCSGEPVASEEYPIAFACTDSGDGYTSSNLQCVSGTFKEPEPAMNEFIYNGQSACPADTDGDLSEVVSYPCEACAGVAGTGLQYNCNETALKASYYSAEDCTGDPFVSTVIESAGCAAVGTPATQVSTTICSGHEGTLTAATGGSVPPAAAAARTAAYASATKVLTTAKAVLKTTLAPKKIYRSFVGGTTCTGPGEGCCGAPSGDVNNCPDSARTDDCDKQNACCCG